jgi:hypothetical protein
MEDPSVPSAWILLLSMGGRIRVESERRGVVVVVVVAAFRRRAAAEAAAAAASTAPSTAPSADASDADQQMNQMPISRCRRSSVEGSVAAACWLRPVAARRVERHVRGRRPVRTHAPAFRSTENVCPTMCLVVAVYARAGPKRGFFDDEGGRGGGGSSEARRGGAS